MTKISDRLYKNIEAGKKGRNIGLSTSIKSLDKIVYGIQKSYITTIFADSGEK